jgi:outer membrane lipoprotein LolB
MNAVRGWLLIAMMALAGCASRPVVPGSGIDWPQRAEYLAQLQGWEASGRIAVKSGAEGGQGSIHWVQESANASIALRGPFGVGAYQIDWTDDDLVITGKAGEVTLAYAGSDAVERFLTDQLGWSFPARSTRYWILGIADPRFSSRTEFDDDGWLATLEQDGWFVSYDRFVQEQGRWMPRKIVMESDLARVKLIVDRWRLNSSSLH